MDLLESRVQSVENVCGTLPCDNVGDDTITAWFADDDNVSLGSKVADPPVMVDGDKIIGNYNSGSSAGPDSNAIIDLHDVGSTALPGGCVISALTTGGQPPSLGVVP